jgi:hypothetical protein
MRYALVLIAACSGSAAPVADPAQPAGDPAPCSAVAAHELAVMSFLPPARASEIKLAIEARCRDDVWPVDARRCIVTASGFDDMSACYDKLTPTQRTAFEHVLRGSDDVPDTTPPPAQPELL